MRKTFWLAYNTTLGILRQRLLYTVLFFALVLIAAGGVLDSAAPGQSGVMVTDIGLGAVNLFGVMIAIVMGVNLLYQELDRKTVYNLLAKPIGRGQFVLAKYLGQLGALAWVMLAMVLCLWVAVAMHQGSTTTLFWEALWAVFLELAMVSAVAMIFSSFSTPYMSGLFTLGIWVVGSLSEEIQSFKTLKKLEIYSDAMEAVFYILPDFAKLNLKDRVPYNLAPPPGYVWQITLYTVLYCAALILLSAAIFRRRDFK